MTFTVYGIREPGANELRYIGQTNKADLIVRVRQHRNDRSPGDPYRVWLNSRIDLIEVVAIQVCETRKEALAWERSIIKACLHLGYRLFNRDWVAGSRAKHRRVRKVR